MFFSFSDNGIDKFFKNMAERKRLVEKEEESFVNRHLSVVTGWNDGYINIQELAFILAKDIYIIGKAERFFSSYDYLNNIIKPSIALALTQGDLPVKDTVYRANVPPQAINTTQLYNYLATVDDIKKWLVSIDRPLPLILRCDKADYPIQFKQQIAAYWVIWPHLKMLDEPPKTIDKATPSLSLSEKLILDSLIENNYNIMALPVGNGNQAGAKNEIWNKVGNQFKNRGSFDYYWRRLKQQKIIVDAK